MKVVCNTSPIIGLAKIEQLLLLKQLFGRALLPYRVFQEFLENCSTKEKDYFQSMQKDCFEIVHVDSLHTFSRRLDRGEKEVLTLAIREQADIVLLDDRKAFNEAKEHQLVVASTRAVLYLAEEQGLITSFQETEAALKKKQFYVPEY